MIPRGVASGGDMSSGAVDVLVVGGGPAGMAAGISFGRPGLRTVVCERGWLPADKPCGEGVMPTGLAYLERLGVSAYLDHEHPAYHEKAGVAVKAEPVAVAVRSQSRLHRSHTTPLHLTSEYMIYF